MWLQEGQFVVLSVLFSNLLAFFKIPSDLVQFGVSSALAVDEFDFMLEAGIGHKYFALDCISELGTFVFAGNDRDGCGKVAIRNSHKLHPVFEFLFMAEVILINSSDFVCFAWIFSKRTSLLVFPFEVDVGAKELTQLLRVGHPRLRDRVGVQEYFLQLKNLADVNFVLGCQMILLV